MIAMRKVTPMKFDNNTPTIRFTGFACEWNQYKLGDIGKSYSGLSGKTKEDFGHGAGRYVTYLNVFSNSITSDLEVDAIEIDKRQNEVKAGDVFFTTSSETPEEVGMTSVCTFDTPDTYLNSFCFGYRLNEARIDLHFLAYNLRSDSFRKKIIALAQGISRYNISKTKVMELRLSLPQSDEQKKIGDYFAFLDNLITLHQRKYEKLVNLKKAMLDKLFPKNGELVPEVRFAGFSGNWERREMGDIVTEYNDPVATPTTGYYRLGIRSFGKGTFHSFVEPGMGLQTGQMHRVAADKFIVNITFGWEHAVAITTDRDEGKLVSHRFPQFSFAEGMVPSFFKFLILDESFKHHLWLASPGGAGRNRVLKISDMLEYQFWVTSKEEQSEVALFLERVDNLIELQRQKVLRIQNLKKAFLEKMFV